jgi:hypothetical protein
MNTIRTRSRGTAQPAEDIIYHVMCDVELINLMHNRTKRNCCNKNRRERFHKQLTHTQNIWNNATRQQLQWTNRWATLFPLFDIIVKQCKNGKQAPSNISLILALVTDDKVSIFIIDSRNHIVCIQWPFMTYGPAKLNSNSLYFLQAWDLGQIIAWKNITFTVNPIENDLF